MKKLGSEGGLAKYGVSHFFQQFFNIMVNGETLEQPTAKHTNFRKSEDAGQSIS